MQSSTDETMPIGHVLHPIGQSWKPPHQGCIDSGKTDMIGPYYLPSPIPSAIICLFCPS